MAKSTKRKRQTVDNQSPLPQRGRGWRGAPGEGPSSAAPRHLLPAGGEKALLYRSPRMIHLGSIRGTTLGVDFSFLILVGLWVASYYDPAAGIQHALLWIPVLFLSVLIHELAHALMIGAFGYGPSEIVLGGIGG